MPEYGDGVFPVSTRRLFARLIRRNRPLVVREIDGQGLPWVSYRFRSRGRMHHHHLALDPGSWVLVRPRSATSSSR